MNQIPIARAVLKLIASIVMLLVVLVSMGIYYSSRTKWLFVFFVLCAAAVLIWAVINFMLVTRASKPAKDI